MKFQLTVNAGKSCVFIAACALLTVFISLNAWRHLDERAVYPGWLLQSYIAEKNQPQNSAADFKTGMAGIYDQSLVMRLALLLHDQFGLTPESYNRIHVFLQTAILISSLVVLIATFTKSLWINWLALLLTLSSTHTLKNLGFFFDETTFTAFLGLPVYYMPAYSMICMALACFFRNRHFAMFLFIGLTIWCHLAMGFMLAVFIGAYFLARPRAALRPAFLAGILLCAGMSLPLASMALKTANFDAAGIPMEEWLKQARMLGSHWFLSSRPSDALKNVHTMLLLTFIFFALLPRLSLERTLREKLMAGAAGVWVFTLAGLVFVEIMPVQAVIRLCPQRSLFLISLLTVPLAVCGLLKLVLESPSRAGRLSAALLFILVMVFWGHRHPRSISLWLLALPLLVGLFYSRSKALELGDRPSVPAPSGAESFPGPHRSLGQWGLPALWIIAALIAGGTGLEARYIHRLYKYYLTPWSGGDLAKVRGFMAVQLWAETDSPGQALFMADPASPYEWQSYSRRPFFGAARAWGWYSIVYVSNAERWREGRLRLKEFGFDLDSIHPGKWIWGSNYPYPYYMGHLLSLIADLYYTMPPERLAYFHREYKVDYAIMEKARLDETHDRLLRASFPVPFENSLYYVLALGDRPDP